MILATLISGVLIGKAVLLFHLQLSLKTSAKAIDVPVWIENPVGRPT